MSVATEIQRLQAAKADIKTAIEAKGVTVPSTTKLDGYASLIEQIGPEPLPYDAEIEYLESTGTQYIETGIIPDADTGVFTKVTPSNSTDSYIFGQRNDSSNTRWGAGHRIGYYYAYETFLNNQINVSSPAIISLNFYNDGAFKAGTSAVALPSMSFTPAYNIRLFGRAGIVASDNAWSGKIYYLKISQGSTTIMDLIPVRVGQVGYMYDKISKQLFGNSGTGSFTLGNDVISDSEALSIITQGE